MTEPSPLGMTGAEAEARRRIAERGPITFAEFMDVALYWPEGGYYTTRRAFGAAGDFYTAPLTHPAFGALLSGQLRSMWELLGRPQPFVVFEAGAGTGRLASDIAAQAPLLDREFGAELRLHAFDRGVPTAGEGRAAGEAGVSASAAASVPVSSGDPAVDGEGLGKAHVILANELVDAMPAHRVTWQDGELREIYVGASPDGRLTEVVGAPSTSALGERLAAVGARLSEGYRAEVNLAMGGWMGWAFGAISRGYLLLIDYGREAAAYYDESRRLGTLRCYERHTLSMDPYAHVGRRDISVHVEFTSLRAAAAAAGFAEAGSMSQAELLRGLGADALRGEIAGRADLSRAARTGNLRQIDLLMDPGGMGSFRALAFAKDAPLQGALGAARGPAGPAPLPGEGHMPIPGMAVGRLPSWEELLR